MQNKLKNIQIVLTGNFSPFSTEPMNLLEISALFHEFHLFPKEVTEQRIEFAQAGQKITLLKSLELVSANQQTILQVRPDMLVYETNISATDPLSNFFDIFIRILRKIENKINFSKVSRLGFIQTEEDSEENIEAYKEANKLTSEIIEHRTRVVLRQTLSSISELVNFVKTVDYISKEAGAPQNILNYSFDINTLADKDAPRFNIIDIENFLTGAGQILIEG
ncbi:hypothetical protein [Acinetobacter sp. G11]|uniref:hypothetical protein n=1 Tax=Acinetobacter sp. G11 TaxID=3415989 RepID=UPI003C7ED50A